MYWLTKFKKIGRSGAAHSRQRDQVREQGDEPPGLQERCATESEGPLDDGGCEWNPRRFLERMVSVVLDASLVANKLGYSVRVSRGLDAPDSADLPEVHSIL
jgi:hypothetical protein